MSQDLLDHKSKCRLCFKRISVIRNNARITEKVREKFFRLTNIELKSSDKYSNYTCKACFQALNETSQFQLKIIDNQRRLYAFENEAEKPIVKEEPRESRTIHLEEVAFADFLPKTEVFDDALVEYQRPEPAEEIPRAASTDDLPDDFDSREEDIENSSLAPAAADLQPAAADLQPATVNKRYKYGHEQLEKAVLAASKKELTIYAAAKRFNVPESTLRGIMDRLLGFLTEEEEIKVKIFVQRRLESGISTSDQKLAAYALRVLRQRTGENRIKIKELPSHWVTYFRNLHSDMVTEPESSEAELSCDVCGFSVKGKRYMRTHMLVHAKASTQQKKRKHYNYSEQDLQEAVKAVVEGRLSAYRASKNYKVPESTIAGRKNVEIAKSEIKIFKCSFCDKVFSIKSSLTEHEKHVHLDLVGEFPCEKCGKVFNKKKKLYAHNYNVHSEQLFKCRKCGETFKKITDLTKHSLNHREKIACSVCGKLVWPGSKMSQHMTCHAAADTHKCPFEGCSRAFQTNCRLKYHITNSHEPNRNVKCPKCEKTFPNEIRLKFHDDRSHGEPRFFCKVEGCSYKNTRRAYLRLHLRNHKDIDAKLRDELIAKIPNGKASY